MRLSKSTVSLLSLLICCVLVTLSVNSAEKTYSSCTDSDWINKSDAQFAADCVVMAFEGGLKEKQKIAWMFFARVNQQIASGKQSGMSGGDSVPLWMTWPTDPDTFTANPGFHFSEEPRTTMMPSIEKKELLAGKISSADPDGVNEEVTRNRISYNYLVNNKLTTRSGIATFFETNDYVNMPVGTIELKASWLQVTPGSPAPDGALIYQFDSGKYWWRGLHIMVKMRELADPTQLFYSEEPSWFWTTFEFNENPGVTHVRDKLITQRQPLAEHEIQKLIATAGLENTDYQNLAPNGTQIRFTDNADGVTPVILGHTDMEDFAGLPNTAQPAYWTSFNASCHSCHATASYNPSTKASFPFSSPTGALDPAYNAADSDGNTEYLGQGFKPLDFMWPIVFQTK